MADWPYSTAAWRNLRGAKLRETPLCESCERVGVVTPAGHVDHRQAIKAGGAPFPTLDGLASLCASCHSIKTNAEDRPDRRARRAVGFARGCGADGLPLDAKHPFVAAGYPVEGRPAAALRTGPSPNSQLVRRGR